MIGFHSLSTRFGSNHYEPLHRRGRSPETTPAADSTCKVVFSWNKRDCTGNRLHKAILDQKLEDVSLRLAEDPEALHERFSYETRFEGNVQEGSGEAIHLAVSRSSVQLVQLLIDHKAALDAMVTRGGKAHYDVLHAAVFSEGRGGEKDVIKCLLDAKAVPTKNLEGHYPLHKAYQCGVFDAIPILKEAMDSELLTEVEENFKGPVPTPLQVGIQTGKLTGEQLSQVASMTSVSLKVFLHDEPRSIPSFVERMKKEGMIIKGSELAEYVSVTDLCKCLREHPLAADVLLDALTQEPEVENEGWHPLPTRMHFGPRTIVDRIRNMFNPPQLVFNTYKPANSWEYNARDFIAPLWHDEITGKFGRPIYDVLMKVCYLPEIVCAEFLAALQDVDFDDIYSNPVVRSVLNTIWWGGAYKLDILQFFITLCGLVMLTVERALWELSLPEGVEQVARRLKVHAGGHENEPVPTEETPPFAMQPTFKPTVADQFIGARGFVDLAHEMVQLAGYIRIGHGRDYFHTANYFDLFRASLAIAFYACEQNSNVQVLLILIYWFRLLEISFSENLMRELLPIMQLAKGLAPSCVVCLIAVCAFTHAKWVMDSRPLWPDTFYDSFSMLITSALPDVGSSDFKLFFGYFAISIFSVFFLNIFISVISENYIIEKESVATSFQKKRCGLCFTYLVRSRVLPCWLMSQRVANAVLSAAGVGALSSLVLSTRGLQLVPEQGVVMFIVCQLLALLASYQDPTGAWAPQMSKCGAPVERYLWIATINAAEPETPQDRIEAALASMQVDLQELKNICAAGRPEPKAGDA